MPFPMKIQPIDCDTPKAKPIVKSRLRRLFEWQFSKNSSVDKPCDGEIECNTDDFEPSSVCLAKMVQNFIEGSNNEKQAAGTTKCSRNHGCNCFNGNCSDSSDDEYYFSGYGDSVNSVEACELLKGLVCCVSKAEKNLLVDASKIVERNKIYNCKRKDDLRNVIIEGLVALGYDASICKSKWEKSSSYPSGEYEYIDVITEGERLLIDIDFKSEFEIARSTGSYRSILQSLPTIFVGKLDRLQRIVSLVSDAAQQSLKKKGMHIPPWRKAEYMRAKWGSPFTTTRTNSIELVPKSPIGNGNKSSPSPSPSPFKLNNLSGDFELASPSANIKLPSENCDATPWEPPAIRPRSSEKGTRAVAGLASIFREKP